jgi:ribosomal protein S18 acetylase RimI-like enzyme
METRQATKADCHAIAELALMAGEGIPAYFWEQSRQPGQEIEDVGAQNAASDTENFSWRNVHLAVNGNAVAGMLLAYRLPDAEHVPGSFYINMLATYPEYRNQAVGTTLMGLADKLAATAGCSLLSVEVFEQNAGALRLYRRLGYAIVDKRPVVPHPCHPYTGDVVLLTKPVSGDNSP